LELLRDEVASVRSNTFSVAAVIIERLALSPGETWHDEFVSSITEFSTGKDYMERQVYVNVCATLVRGKVSGLLGGNVLRVLRVLLQENGGDDFFESKLVPPLLQLAEDKVANIRLSVAQFIGTAPEWFASTPQVVAVVEKLGKDVDRNTREAVGVYTDPPAKAKVEESVTDDIAPGEVALEGAIAEEPPAEGVVAVDGVAADGAAAAGGAVAADGAAAADGAVAADGVAAAD
jgi:hypothetical protein